MREVILTALLSVLLAHAITVAWTQGYAAWHRAEVDAEIAEFEKWHTEHPLVQ